MESSPKLAMFNSYTMMISSNNFYYSSFLLVVMCTLFDIGINRILYSFDLIHDPLRIKVSEYDSSFIELKKLKNKQNKNKFNLKNIKNKCIIFF